MIKSIFGLFLIAASSLLISCSEDVPSGPDLTNIDVRDHAYFNEIYNRCNVGNTQNDCNCIARVNVKERAIAYSAYAADYETVHKIKLETDIKKMTATLTEKTMNRSDERVLEAMTEDLHHLKVKLENGIDNIDDFELPFLPKGATDVCVISG